MSGQILLNNVSVDTDSETFSLIGGFNTIVIRGDNYGGGTINIQARSKSDPNLRWGNLPNGEFTEDATVIARGLEPNLELRASFSGSTGASNVFVELL